MVTTGGGGAENDIIDTEIKNEEVGFQPNASGLTFAPSAPVLNPPEGGIPHYTFPQSYGKALRPSRKNRVWLNSETETIGTEISEIDYQAELLRNASTGMVMSLRK
jgi:hypothetical protein